MSCTYDGYNFHTELFFTTIIPTVVLVGLALYLLVKGSDKSKETLVYLVCTLSLVPISTICFESMSCSEYQFNFDDETGTFEMERRLRADLRIDCDDPAHQFWEWYAMVMLALYPIGVPLLGAGLLWKNKTAIRSVLADLEEKGKAGNKVKTAVPEDIDRFKSLFIYYRPNCFWWGLADVLQRLLLTGLHLQPLACFLAAMM